MKQSAIRIAACAGVVCSVMATVARGQSAVEFEAFRDRSITKLALLQNEQVQNELKLTAGQKQKLNGLNSVGRGRGSRITVDPEAQFRAMMQDFEERAIATLDANQLKRLKEIVLQVNSIGVNLRTPEIASELQLTEDQQRRIQTVVGELTERVREAFSKARNGDGGQLAIANWREAMNQDLLAVLTDEQRATLEAMKGAPFEIDRATLFRRRPTPPASNSVGLAAPVPLKWEYKVIGKEGNEKLFNELGDDGWELVAGGPDIDEGGHSTHRFYFKRPKRSE